MGFLLGAGIFLFPYLFAWFLLRRGYSVLARVVAFAWLAVVVLFVVGSANRTPGPAGVAGQAAAPDAPAAAAAVIPVGTSARIGGLEVTITGIEQRQAVGVEGLMKTASEGGTLVVVKYATKNISHHPLGGFRTNGLVLIDPAGVKYNQDTEKTVTYQMEGGPDNKLFDDINPGITTHGAGVFEVSKTAFNPSSWRAKLGSDDALFALQ